MNQYRWWHRIRGHKIGPVVFNVEEYEREARIKGHSPATINALIPFAATRVVDRCSCGDEWVFSAMSFTESYVPGGGTLTITDLRPR